MMNKQVRSVFLFDEPEAFTVIKPFNSSIGHIDILLSFKISTLLTGGCHFDKWDFPTERNYPAIKGRDLID
jgi:hypothetical protein